jgi:hypothetical protein
MIIPVLAGLGALACMGNPRRRRKARRRNPVGVSLTPYKQTFGRHKQSVLSSHGGALRRKIMRMQFPRSTREDHARAARGHHQAAAKYDKAWGRIADKASKETFDRPWTFSDYRVSGIGRSEFPERLKKLLRSAAHRASEHNVAAAAHEAMAGVTAIRKVAKSNPCRKRRSRR